MKAHLNTNPYVCEKGREEVKYTYTRLYYSLLFVSVVLEILILKAMCRYGLWSCVCCAFVANVSTLVAFPGLHVLYMLFLGVYKST